MRLRGRSGGGGVRELEVAAVVFIVPSAPAAPVRWGQRGNDPSASVLQESDGTFFRVLGHTTPVLTMSSGNDRFS